MRSEAINSRINSAATGMLYTAEGMIRGTAAAACGVLSIVPGILAVATLTVMIESLFKSDKDKGDRSCSCYHWRHYSCHHCYCYYPDFSGLAITSLANEAGRQWNGMCKAYGKAANHFSEIIWPASLSTRYWRALRF